MKKILFIFVAVWSVVRCSALGREGASAPSNINSPALVNSDCLASKGETAADCPFAVVARAFQSAAAQKQDLGPVLDTKMPGIAAQMQNDAHHTEWLTLWGEALNYDEGGGGMIVDPAIIDLFNDRMGVSPRRNVNLPNHVTRLVTHAGVQHTYSYLFSTLPTSFGFKRARWVLGDVTAGFGLPEGTLSPMPREGSLFANATMFAGEIAFANDAKELSMLRRELAKDPSMVAEAIRNFDFSSLRVQRLTETINMKDSGRVVELRTDFVPFTRKSGSANTHWLIYSVHDSADHRSRLITVFPITQPSYKKSTAASLLGSEKPIITRYNAYVEGVTGVRFRGERRLRPITMSR